MKYTIYAEMKKIWFSRFSRIYLLMTIALGVLIGLLFALTTNVTQSRNLTELKPMEVITANMLGVDVATILLIFFIAILIGREFQSKTIETYLMVTPNRTKYFISKALHFFILSLGIGFIVALLTLGNGQLILRLIHKETLPMSDGLQFAMGCIFMPMFYVLLTVCGAFFLRSTAAGIATPLTVMFLPAVTKLLPQSLQDVIVPFLPATAIHSISGVAQKGGPEDIGIIMALIVLFIWSLIACALAIWGLRRKDI
ncbi:MAG: ABC transporter permease [Dysgonamonadaceae bacterium]|nr:ABC transporter permease [Dysgonamonadaceae bacterium]